MVYKCGCRSGLTELSVKQWAYAITGSNPVPHTFMHKQQTKKRVEKDPYYKQGGITMVERIQHVPHQEKGAHLITELAGAVEKNIERLVPPDINLRRIKAHLPDLSGEEVASFAVKKGLAQIKNLDGNPFGSLWNQIAAEVAGERLGLPSQSLHKIIVLEGPTGIKLREVQREVARETEVLLKKKALEREHIVNTIKFEVLMGRLAEETRRDLLEVNPDLAKQAKEVAINDVVNTLVRIMELSEGQRLDFSRMRKTLVRARLGESLRVVDLHCLAFVNSPVSGISVSPTADDFEIQDARGVRLRITQRAFFTGVEKMIRILQCGGINPTLEILVIDNDKFVRSGQAANVNCFVESLREVVKRDKFLGQLSVEFVRASEITDLGRWQDEWERRSRTGDKLAERVVNEEFERLTLRDLPPELKTREFARKIAGRSFCVQAAIGAHLAEREMILAMQSTRAQQQATELARVGSKGENLADPIIVAHWTGHEAIEPVVN